MSYFVLIILGIPLLGSLYLFGHTQASLTLMLIWLVLHALYRIVGTGEVPDFECVLGSIVLRGLVTQIAAVRTWFEVHESHAVPVDQRAGAYCVWMGHKGRSERG
jgi:hypothetical protein